MIPGSGNHLVDDPIERKRRDDESRGKSRFDERDYLLFKVRGRSLAEAKQIVRAWRSEVIKTPAQRLLEEFKKMPVINEGFRNAVIEDLQETIKG